MKITRTTWLLLALGVFVIAFATLFVIYSHQASQNKDLKNDLAKAEASYPQLALQIRDLESELAERQSELTAALSNLSEVEAKFPASVQSFDYYQRLLAVAANCNLNVSSLTVSGPRQQKVDSVAYQVTTFDITVAGQVSGILDFTHILATTEDFISATIEVVNISIPRSPSGQEITSQQSDATLRLDVYAYRGA